MGLRHILAKNGSVVVAEATGPFQHHNLFEVSHQILAKFRRCQKTTMNMRLRGVYARVGVCHTKRWSSCRIQSSMVSHWLSTMNVHEHTTRTLVTAPHTKQTLQFQ